MKNGKGSSPRNNLSQKFRDNYVEIKWSEKGKRQSITFPYGADLNEKRVAVIVSKKGKKK